VKNSLRRVPVKKFPTGGCDGYGRTFEMQLFVRIAGRRILLSVNPTDSVLSVQEQVSEQEGIPIDLQRLLYSGAPLDPVATLEAQSVSDDATLDLFAPADGGKKKKKKKKAFTSKKRVPHKRKKVPLKLLKLYKINKDGSVEPQRQFCDQCPGSFLAVHKGNGEGKRTYCGHCHSPGK
jgi:small subunit ribosomal protein S27Ae